MVVTPEEKRKKDTDRQRRYRERIRDSGTAGPESIRVKVDDPQAWRAIMEARSGQSLAAATEFYIDEECRAYRHRLVEADWARFSNMRTGHIARTPVSEDSDQVITPRRPSAIGTLPNEMTAEQEKLAWAEGMNEWHERLAEEQKDNEGYLPETGRVNTKRRDDE
jgi:hypothetical protein